MPKIPNQWQVTVRATRAGIISKLANLRISKWRRKNKI